MMSFSFPVLPTISTSFIVLSAISVAIGWKQIREKKLESHLRSMRIAAIFALAFFIIYASRTVFVGNTAFGGPDSMKIFYTIFLIFHVVLASVGAILGIVSLYSGAKKKLTNHRRLGPVTSTVWFFTAFTGLAVYMLLYVVYQGGETTSVVKAILGV